ncbi:unnamed protein product [Prorocentrum cordatum]|uniref:Uncharacterized protein n=1 Tax=Prorocentrum cordatum TaxID=2364126 RepID=A0ABN9W528_9DINO|nr:unnamed protein product [Polarella glacialis]
MGWALSPGAAEFGGPVRARAPSLPPVAAAAPPMGEAGPSAADLEDALAGLRKGWERLAIRGLGTGTAAGSSSSAGASGLRSWRGLTAEVLSAVPSCLAIPERLAPRLASRAWWRACEQGAARGAWAEALGAGAGAGRRRPRAEAWRLSTRGSTSWRTGRPRGSSRATAASPRPTSR